MEIKCDYEIIKDYSRGSDDKTYLCLDSNGYFFRKIAYGKKNIDKLKSQVKWLYEFNNIISLTNVDDYCISGKQMFYDMRFNQGETFSEYICKNSDVGLSMNILTKILSDLEKSLYKINKEPTNRKKQIEKYIDEKVTSNYKSMIGNHILKDVIKYDYIKINGKKYPNIQMYYQILSKEKLYNIFADDICGEIHGDLTLENIIISSKGKDYYLIDPNTNNFFNSIYLDYSKILQSLHGKYELIRKKDSKVELSGDNICISYCENENYDKIFDLYKKFLDSHFSYKQQKSIYFHEIVHWLRMYKYRNKHEPDKIMLYYAVFLIILKDVCDMFGEEII